MFKFNFKTTAFFSHLLFSKKAFTLAEMMVVMLIMSIVLAAMAPVMTARYKSSSENTSPWKWQDMLGIYTIAPVAMIGQNRLAAGDDISRFIINSDDTRINQILFKKNSTTQGILRMDSNNEIVLGSLASGITLGSNSIAIGKGTAPTLDDSIAIGRNASITEYDGYGSKVRGIAIGLNATTQNVSIAIGPNSAGFHNSVTIGSEATTSSGGTVAIGNEAHTYGTNGNSTAVGHKAIAGSATDPSSYGGGGSTAIGTSARGGVISTAVGNGAKNYTMTCELNEDNTYKSCTTDSLTSYSTALGNNATSGYFATAIGHAAYAASQSSLAVGASAKAIGARSTAIGESAQATKASSTALGRNARSLNDSAIAIGGGYTALTIASGSSSIAIGFDSQATTSSAIAIGGTSRSTGSGGSSVAIGYSSKASATSAFAIGTYAEASGEYSYAIGRKAIADTANTIVLGTSNYSVKIPGKLFVNGTEISATTTSDRRLKYVGTESKSGLDKIKQLKVFNYTFKKDDQKTPHVGVIAQDLQKIFPNAVKRAADGFLTIRMEDMFYAMVNAIKELDAKVVALTETMKEVQSEIKLLREENKALEKRIRELER